MPSLHLNGIAKRFTGHTALHDLSLTVRDGEIFTLLGPSGCGKSTTLWSIAGLHRPDSGSIAFGDRVVYDHGRVNTLRSTATAAWSSSPTRSGPTCRCTTTSAIRSSCAGATRRSVTAASGRSSNSSSWAGMPSATRTNCPEGNSSVWPSPGPWPTRPTCCFWTSPSPTWTPNSATAPVSGSRPSRNRSVSPPSSSRTTRTRPCPSATASPSWIRDGYGRSAHPPRSTTTLPTCSWPTSWEPSTSFPPPSSTRTAPTP